MFFFKPWACVSNGLQGAHLAGTMPRLLVKLACLSLVGCGQGTDPAQESVRAAEALVRSSQVWLPGCGTGRCSGFKTSSNWFDSNTRDRIWLADVTGPDASGVSVADIVGIAADGSVTIANGSGTDFGTPMVKLARSVFTTAAGYFSNSYRQRVWVSDMTGDGRADLVGISDDGTIHLYASTGSGFAAPTASVSPFSRSGGFFDAMGSASQQSNTRVWLADVNGDGKQDFLGVGFTGDIWISTATGTGFAPAIGPISSSFDNAGGWFDGEIRDHVWVANFVAGSQVDILGIAPNGDVMVSEGTPGGGFKPSHWIAQSVFQRAPGVAGISWFDKGYRSRIWATSDVSGDGKADIVGIAPPGIGDGDVWVLRSTPAGFAQKVWLYDSNFKTGPAHDNWFSLQSQPRVWLSDISGDGRPDLVGVNPLGEVWAAKADSAAATAPGSPTKNYFFQPSLMVAQSQVGSSAYFNPQYNQRIWLADVTGDKVNDIVAIAPPGTSQRDGSVIWTQVLPTKVKSISPLSRAQLTGAAVTLKVGFSRRVNCMTMTQSSLRVFQKMEPATAETIRSPQTTIQPSAPSFTCNFTRSFVAAATGDVKIRKEFEGLSARDRWNQEIDGNGNGFRDKTADQALRVDYLYGQLTAAASKAIVPLPAYPNVPGRCSPSMPAGTTSTIDCPSPMVRAIVLGNSDKVIVFVEIETVGVNPGRFRDLISARTGIPEENIFISATHAHGVPWTIALYSGPGFDDRSIDGRPFEVAVPDPYAYVPLYPYLQWIEDRASEQVAQAFAKMVPVQIGAGSKQYPSSPDRRPAGVNRWYGAQQSSSLCDSANGVAKLDPTLGVIGLRTNDGQPLALIVNYAEHPVTLAPSYAMSTDFPGFMSKTLEDAGYTVGMFINGAAGDIDPLDVFSSDPAIPWEDGVDFALAAMEVTATPNFFGPTTGMQIGAVRDVHEFTGPSSCATGIGCITTDVNARRLAGAPSALELESTSLVVTRSTTPKQRVFALTSIPGELFIKGQLDLRAAVGANTFVFGYTNGYYGYLPDSQARQCAIDLSIPGDPFSCKNFALPMCPDPAAPPAPSPPPRDDRQEPLCYLAYTCSDGASDYATAVYVSAGGNGLPTAGESMISTAAARLQVLQQ
ncbi:MAG: VCBS repeat-containing protein [Myxococcales bacterium]